MRVGAHVDDSFEFYHVSRNEKIIWFDCTILGLSAVDILEMSPTALTSLVKEASVLRDPNGKVAFSASSCEWLAFRPKKQPTYKNIVNAVMM
jgi:hypothetical protein